MRACVCVCVCVCVWERERPAPPFSLDEIHIGISIGHWKNSGSISLTPTRPPSRGQSQGPAAPLLCPEPVPRLGNAGSPLWSHSPRRLVYLRLTGYLAHQSLGPEATCVPCSLCVPQGKPRMSRKCRLMTTMGHTHTQPSSMKLNQHLLQRTPTFQPAS